jgi:hypothetical protein
MSEKTKGMIDCSGGMSIKDFAKAGRDAFTKPAKDRPVNKDGHSGDCDCKDCMAHRGIK